MNKFLFITCLLISTQGFAQDTIPEKTKGEEVSRHYYIPLNKVKADGIVLSREDSLNFRYLNGDTLVLVRPGFNISTNNGVRVKYIPKDSLFLEIYEDVVFGKQPVKNGRKNTLKLWKEDVKIFFDSTVPKSYRGNLMSFASEISSEIDSLKISEVSLRKNANYVVYFRNDSTAIDPEPRVTSKNGGYYVNWNSRQVLTSGVLKINAFKIPSSSHRNTLLRWYFFKSLGYFQYSDLLDCESYLSNCSQGGVISEKDHEILKYHYAYSNCVGNDRESFKSFHEGAMSTLKRIPDAQIFVVHF